MSRSPSVVRRVARGLAAIAACVVLPLAATAQAPRNPAGSYAFEVLSPNGAVKVQMTVEPRGGALGGSLNADGFPALQLTRVTPTDSGAVFEASTPDGDGVVVVGTLTADNRFLGRLTYGGLELPFAGSFTPAAGAAGAAAPVADRDAVLAVVTGLFDAMRARDTTRMRAAFEPGAALASATVGRDGAPVVQRTAISDWLVGVARGGASAPVLDERLRNPIVSVDGTLATVWVEYALFVGPAFSHCGVDAFTLAKTGGAWRIVSVADSRRRTGCEGWTTAR
jgi:hypothetical protein